MPPAGSGRPLHPCLLPASPRRSLSDKKSFHLEAEGNRPSRLATAMQRHVAGGIVSASCGASIRSCGAASVKARWKAYPRRQKPRGELRRMLLTAKKSKKTRFLSGNTIPLDTGTFHLCEVTVGSDACARRDFSGKLCR
ncbi:MAG: hypothetical protein LBQ54_00510 [Planctomycetaceae bacterium]|nr:hypothetical protein [Planctomycetaceae bacterium]